MTDAQDLVPWMAAATKKDVASLAPLILAVAGEGDPTASEIQGRALDALAQHLDVARRAWAQWEESFPLAVSGGLLKEGGLLRGPFLERARAMGAQVEPGPVVAVRGAARLARVLLG